MAKITTRQILELHGISKYTLRNWRRGWYTDERGQHFFFPDKHHLEYKWNNKVRRFEYAPSKVAAWIKSLKDKHAKKKVSK